MAMIDQDAHASAPQEQTSLSVRYRYQVQLPDGRLLSGEIAEQEVPEGVRGACKVPQRHATLAVTMAERDRAEQPEAPTLPEYQSDEWTKGKAKLDRAHASEAAWNASAARWVKICPGA